MDKRIWKPLAMTLAVSAASVSQAYADVDIDNDGLIEISTLQQLDLMRYDLAGTSLNGDSTGCPATGCNGYELVADLDFDTNGNGVADAGDLFWNGGEGWEPVGDTYGSATYAQKKVTGAVTAKFNGNGFTIANLFINRADRSWVGLFSNIYGSQVDNLVLRGADVTGGDATGVFTGGINDTDINYIRVIDSSVSGIDEVGMISGRIFGDGDLISSVNVSGSVQGEDYAGGVAGWIQSDNPSSNESQIVVTDIHTMVNITNDYYTGCVSGVARGAQAESILSKCVINSPTNYSGGVFGSIGYGSISDVYIASHITGMHDVGGVAGSAGKIIVSGVAVGSESTISSAHAGGMFGQLIDSTVSDSYVLGEVTGKWNAAGLIYRVRGSVVIENTFAAGPLIVTGKADPERKAGLVRDIYYSETTLQVDDSYWDIEATGTSLSVDGYGESKTTAELTCPTLYSDESCDTSLFSQWTDQDWDFGTSSDYPVLR
jgi:hypothetical protein|tara:strand:+ start:518 stop:1981 length:1464 start_codon:yes stop_codon:yes gene_type:complete